MAEEPGYFDVRSWGDKNGPATRWGWRLITSSGVTIANSFASFDSREAAEAAIAWVKDNASEFVNLDWPHRAQGQVLGNEATSGPVKEVRCLALVKLPSRPEVHRS